MFSNTWDCSSLRKEDVIGIAKEVYVSRCMAENSKLEKQCKSRISNIKVVKRNWICFRNNSTISFVVLRDYLDRAGKI